MPEEYVDFITIDSGSIRVLAPISDSPEWRGLQQIAHFAKKTLDRVFPDFRVRDPDLTAQQPIDIYVSPFDSPVDGKINVRRFDQTVHLDLPRGLDDILVRDLVLG